MNFSRLSLLLLVSLILIQTIFVPGLAAQAAEKKSDRSTALLVTDDKDQLQTLTALLKENGYEVTLRPQKQIGAPISGYDVVFVCVRRSLLDKAETELVNYAKGGGRLVVLYDGLNPAKRQNKKWLDLLGIKLYPREDKKYSRPISDPTRVRMVNLMPEHYITSHKVKYDKTAYTSVDWPDLSGPLLAFDLSKTKVYNNIRSTDGSAKVILLGSKSPIASESLKATKKSLMDKNAGWYKRTGRGWAFYFQLGHSEADFRNPNFAQILLNCLAWQPDNPKYAAAPTIKPLFKTVDLNIGESADVVLTGGRKVSLKLVDLKQEFDSIRHAVRGAKVTVEIDGKPLVLNMANYNLPVTFAGLQIDCPVAGECVHTTKKKMFNPWDLHKDVRLRLWSADSPWVRPETYGYHANGALFFSDTQMGSDPTYVNSCDKHTKNKYIYYHYGLDIGGNEGQFEIVAAADGVVVSARGVDLPGYQKNMPIRKRKDVIYVLDRRGWFYRYSHFYKIYDSVKLGQRVRRGQPLGLLGKKGASGGWSHSHFDLSAVQPTGNYGIEEAYPFMWQTYLAASGTKLEAIARPHRLLQRGEEVTLDGSRSWSALGKDGIVSYEWTFCDGTTAKGPKVTRRYNTAGSWSEILKVTDREGRTDYDFYVVLVVDLKRKGAQYPPTIHATYYPTTNIKAGDLITFQVRSFGIGPTDGYEEWDFGDGTAKAKVRSDGNKEVHAKDGYAITTHRYAKPGSYLVSVCRTNCHGQTAIGRLHIVVE